MRVKTLILSGLTSVGSLIILLLIFHTSFVGAEASQRENSNAGWIDQFDSPTLNSRWEWVREDPAHWSLTDRPGFLRIVTQEGSLYRSGTGKNILLTEPALENYQISTIVDFEPTERIQQASLVIYQDDDNYLELGYRNVDDNMVTYRLETSGDIWTTNLTVNS